MTGVAPRPGVELLLVAAGGAVGTALRVLLGAAVPEVDAVPVGILLINLVGAFALGLLVEVLARRGPDAGRRRGVRLLLGTGVLGGFTTYSALAVGTTLLVEGGRPLAGIAYGLGTVLLGALCTMLGILAGRLVPVRTAGRA